MQISNLELSSSDYPLTDKSSSWIFWIFFNKLFFKIHLISLKIFKLVSRFSSIKEYFEVLTKLE